VEIIKYPHPTLRHKSKMLRRVDAELKSTVRQMFDLMYAEKGIGLAANQVDLPYRLFIINLTGEAKHPEEEHVFINPVISRSGSSVEAEEGCLSFPGIYAPVTRPERARIEAYNLSGEEVQLDLTGLFARAVQHEFDHLDGVLFIDRLSETKLADIRDELTELQWQFRSNQERGLAPNEVQVAARLTQLEKLRT